MWQGLIISALRILKPSGAFLKSASAAARFLI
jgi:hypothetical protein